MATWTQDLGWSVIGLSDTATDKEKALSQWSQNVVNYFKNAIPGQYTTTRDNMPTEDLNQLVTSGVISQQEADKYIQDAKDSFRNYYSQTLVQPWDSTLGYSKPGETFDSTYYAKRYPDAVKAWDDAVAKDDLDVIGRYTKDSFLQQDYTQRHLSGEPDLRASAETPLTKSATYQETLTDADYQKYRDQILGLASPGQPTTQLETQFQTAVESQNAQKQQVFGALREDVLKQTVEQIKKATVKQENLSLFNQLLPEYSEVTNINADLANSVIADLQAGGISPFKISGKEATTSLEEKFSKLTGIPSSNSVIYNWQKWFDDTLSKRYQGGFTLKDPTDPNKEYTLDADFAKSFINEYLKPRFDTSRSMDEFKSYLDVKQGEENIFQTQNVFQSQQTMDTLRTLADTRAKAYLDGVKNQAALNFDSDFYFNPTGNEERSDEYAKQTETVNKDWEAAKNGDAYWKEKAYQYGVDVNNKDQFARLHYELKGSDAGYDAAKDVITLKNASDYISDKIIPAIVSAQIDLNDTQFLKLVTPEEFTTALFKGVEPTDIEKLKEIASEFGLKQDTVSLDDLKTYIADSVRTGAAADIRDGIKYLNEQKVQPTQKELGITYIQRPEDVQKETKGIGETYLYNTFKKAGYQGTEDEFYTDFMPDVDRQEQTSLTQAGKGPTPLSSLGITTTSSTPFSGMDTLSQYASLLSTDDTQTDSSTDWTNVYSKLGTGTSSSQQTKSKTGQDVLSDFTSLFSF